MDSIRDILLVLGRFSNVARLTWQAEEATARARLQAPRRGDHFSYYLATDHCVIAALTAARLPSGFRLGNTTLSSDPMLAASQVQQITFTPAHTNPIEAEHEAARLAYLSAASTPPSAEEEQLVHTLAALSPARRDAVIDLAERVARRPRDLNP